MRYRKWLLIVVSPPSAVLNGEGKSAMDIRTTTDQYLPHKVQEASQKCYLGNEKRASVRRWNKFEVNADSSMIGMFDM